MKVSREFHHIQRHIIRVLGVNEWARYKDLRLPGIDCSLYNYHLKELLKTGLIEKVVGKGYRLTPRGLRYVDHVSMQTFEPRWQPKIITKMVIVDEHGRVLMYRKMRQPFVGAWNLPGGKMHYEDESIVAAATREAGMVLSGAHVDPTYCGTLELTVATDGETITHTLYMVHYVRVPEGVAVDSAYSWIDIAAMDSMVLTPGSREIFAFATDTDAEHYAFVALML